MEAAGKRYIRYGSRRDTFTIWGVGDLHLGNPGFDEKRLKRDLKQIECDPFSYWIGLGDNADFIAPGDKRFCAEHLDAGAKLNIGRLGKYYMEQVHDLFYPIRRKCLGLLYGNHEEKYFQRMNDEDAHAWLCQELEVPNLKYCAIFDLVFTRCRTKVPVLATHQLPHSQRSNANSWRVYCHHGSGGATTPGGKLNTLIRHMQNMDADLYFMGHVHDQKGQRMVTIGADASCRKITERQRVGVICGSYLRTYKQGSVGYGEVKGYAPTSLGAAKVKCDGWRRRPLPGMRAPDLPVRRSVARRHRPSTDLLVSVSLSHAQRPGRRGRGGTATNRAVADSTAAAAVARIS
jgi:hypothetical protein